jgi:hypothetical protein
VLLLALQLALAACGSDNLLLPRDGEPARISVVNGSDRTGTVGQSLGDSLVVRVTDSEDRPVPDVEVVFVSPPGSALAPNDTVRTGSNGEAAVFYTLSTTAGEQMVEARATPIVPPSASTATFRVLAQPEGAEKLVPASGDGQSAPVATALPESLAVRAVDRFGNGVAGIEVTWQATGGGSVSPSSAITGPDGRAATQRTLGDRPGSYQSMARAEGLEGSPVALTATAIGPQLVLVTQPSSTASAGVPLEQQPDLQLQDPFGAPLHRADVGVTAQIAGGSGSLGGKTTARSDENGRVRFTNLEIRGEPGARTLIFAADGFTPVTSAGITVSAGPPSREESSVSVPDGTAGAPTTITVRLEDEFGSDVNGAAGSIAIAVDGSNQASGLPVTELGGGAYSASYVPIRTGTDLVEVRVDGATLADGPVATQVAPGPADPSTTTAAIRRSGILFTAIEITVTTKDAQGNLLGRGGDRVQVQLNDGAVRDATDNGDGTYSDAFVTIAFDIRITITLNGVPLTGSPFFP